MIRRFAMLLLLGLAVVATACGAEDPKPSDSAEPTQHASKENTGAVSEALGTCGCAAGEKSVNGGACQAGTCTGIPQGNPASCYSICLSCNFPLGTYQLNGITSQVWLNGRNTCTQYVATSSGCTSAGICG